METAAVSFFYVSLCFVVFCLRDGIARNNVALRFSTLTPLCGDESRPQPSNVSCERHERFLRVLRPVRRQKNVSFFIYLCLIQLFYVTGRACHHLFTQYHPLNTAIDIMALPRDPHVARPNVDE